MKRSILTLLIPILCCLATSAQDHVVTSSTKQNEINIDLDMVSFSASLARKINNKWLVGGGVGIGASINFALNWNGEPMAEYLSIQLLNNYKPSKILDIELGLKGAILGWGGKGENEGLWDGAIGFYLKPLIGTRNIKIGTQFFAGSLGLRNELIYWTPLVVRASLPI